MGRIQQTFVKRVAVEIIENHGDQFTTDFDHTKQSLQKLIDEGLVYCPSKRIRNRLAGSLVNMKRPKKFTNVLAAPSADKSARDMLKDRIEAARQRIKLEKEQKREELDKSLKEAKEKIAKKVSEKKKAEAEKKEKETAEKKTEKKETKTKAKSEKKTTKKADKETKTKEETPEKEAEVTKEE